MSVLIVYATLEGQTGKIARFVEKLVLSTGEPVECLNTTGGMVRPDFSGVKKIILAASVHERRHPEAFERFVRRYRHKLHKLNSLLISVSLSAGFPEGMEDAQDYLDEMKMRTGFEPEHELLVAGAVSNTGYTNFDESVLRHVVLRGKQDTDTLRAREFTDWDGLARSVCGFLRAT